MWIAPQICTSPIRPKSWRFHGESIAVAGLYLGLGSAVGGFIGIVLDCIIADYFGATTVNARLYVGW